MSATLSNSQILESVEFLGEFLYSHLLEVLLPRVESDSNALSQCIVLVANLWELQQRSKSVKLTISKNSLSSNKAGSIDRSVETSGWMSLTTLTSSIWFEKVLPHIMGCVEDELALVEAGAHSAEQTEYYVNIVIGHLADMCMSSLNIDRCAIYSGSIASDSSSSSVISASTTTKWCDLMRKAVLVQLKFECKNRDRSSEKSQSLLMMMKVLICEGRWVVPKCFLEELHSMLSGSTSATEIMGQLLLEVKKDTLESREKSEEDRMFEVVEASRSANIAFEMLQDSGLYLTAQTYWWKSCWSYITVHTGSSSHPSLVQTLEKYSNMHTWNMWLENHVSVTGGSAVMLELFIAAISIIGYAMNGCCRMGCVLRAPPIEIQEMVYFSKIIELRLKWLNQHVLSLSGHYPHLLMLLRLSRLQIMATVGGNPRLVDELDLCLVENGIAKKSNTGLVFIEDSVVNLPTGVIWLLLSLMNTLHLTSKITSLTHMLSNFTSPAEAKWEWVVYFDLLVFLQEHEDRHNVSPTPIGSAVCSRGEIPSILAGMKARQTEVNEKLVVAHIRTIQALLLALKQKHAGTDKVPLEGGILKELESELLLVMGRLMWVAKGNLRENAQHGCVAQLLNAAKMRGGGVNSTIFMYLGHYYTRKCLLGTAEASRITELENGVKCYSRSLELNALNTEAGICLVQCYLLLGKLSKDSTGYLSKCHEALTNAVQSCSFAKWCYAIRGLLLLWEGNKVEEATVAFQIALEHQVFDDLSEGQDICKSVFADCLQNTLDVNSWFGLGIAYYNSGQYVSARKAFIKTFTYMDVGVGSGLDSTSCSVKVLCMLGDIERSLCMLSTSLGRYESAIQKLKLSNDDSSAVNSPFNMKVHPHRICSDAVVAIKGAAETCYGLATHHIHVVGWLEDGYKLILRGLDYVDCILVHLQDTSNDALLAQLDCDESMVLAIMHSLLILKGKLCGLSYFCGLCHEDAGGVWTSLSVGESQERNLTRWLKPCVPLTLSNKDSKACGRALLVEGEQAFRRCLDSVVQHSLTNDVGINESSLHCDIGTMLLYQVKQLLLFQGGALSKGIVAEPLWRERLTLSREAFLNGLRVCDSHGGCWNGLGLCSMLESCDFGCGSDIGSVCAPEAYAKAVCCFISGTACDEASSVASISNLSLCSLGHKGSSVEKQESSFDSIVVTSPSSWIAIGIKKLQEYCGLVSTSCGILCCDGINTAVPAEFLNQGRSMHEQVLRHAHDAFFAALEVYRPPLGTYYHSLTWCMLNLVPIPAVLHLPPCHVYCSVYRSNSAAHWDNGNRALTESARYNIFQPMSRYLLYEPHAVNGTSNAAMAWSWLAWALELQMDFQSAKRAWSNAIDICILSADGVFSCDHIEGLLHRYFRCSVKLFVTADPGSDQLLRRFVDCCSTKFDTKDCCENATALWKAVSNTCGLMPGTVTEQILTGQAVNQASAPVIDYQKLLKKYPIEIGGDIPVAKGKGGNIFMGLWDYYCGGSFSYETFEMPDVQTFVHLKCFDLLSGLDADAARARGVLLWDILLLEYRSSHAYGISHEILTRCCETLLSTNRFEISNCSSNDSFILACIHCLMRSGTASECCSKLINWYSVETASTEDNSAAPPSDTAVDEKIPLLRISNVSTGVIELLRIVLCNLLPVLGTMVGHSDVNKSVNKAGMGVVISHSSERALKDISNKLRDLLQCATSLVDASASGHETHVAGTSHSSKGSNSILENDTCSNYDLSIITMLDSIEIYHELVNLLLLCKENSVEKMSDSSRQLMLDTTQRLLNRNPECILTRYVAMISVHIDNPELLVATSQKMALLVSDYSTSTIDLNVNSCGFQILQKLGYVRENASSLNIVEMLMKLFS